MATTIARPLSIAMASGSIPAVIAAPSPPKAWELPGSGLTVFHGHPQAPRLFHYFLPRLVMLGKHILCLDGANRFDPLLIARFARRTGKASSVFNQRIRVARAFTCFQLTELLVRMPRLLRHFPAEVLVVTALPDVYFDEDIREREAAASFRQALEVLKTLARSRLSVAVFSDGSSFRTPRQQFFRQLIACAGQVRRFTEQSGGKLALLAEKDAPRNPRALS